VPDGRPSFAADEQARIDAILEKISQHGLDSLTEREKEILRGASRPH
jgi:hypothetical protein